MGQAGFIVLWVDWADFFTLHMSVMGEWAITMRVRDIEHKLTAAYNNCVRVGRVQNWKMRSEPHSTKYGTEGIEEESIVR